MLHLSRRGGLMRGACCCLFCASRARSDAALSAIKAYPVDRGVVHDRLCIGVVNVGDVHMADCGVVVEMVTLPVSALVPLTKIAEAVVDAAVEPYARAPVSGVKRISSVTPTPIAGCPEQADCGGLH